METISLKLEKPLLKSMEKAMKEHHYATKTEFIRESIRKQIAHLDADNILKKLDEFRKNNKNKTSNSELSKAREKAFEELVNAMK